MGTKRKAATTNSRSSAEQVRRRSGKHCEAYVGVTDEFGMTYTRCFKEPVEIHHMLTRSRGGLILDQIGETAHLIALCPEHHKTAHAPDGHAAGLMINGYVTTGPDGSVVYQGTDRRLAHLRALDLSAMQEALSNHPAGKGLRGQTHQ